MATDEKTQQAYHEAHRWNVDHPVGSPVLAWPGVREGEPLVTRTRTPAWPLPAGDVVVSVDGHAGGIAITHIKHDPSRQPAVPDIVFETPPCPICGVGLDTDGDSFVCSPCGASWPMSGEGGTWFTLDAPRCLATIHPYVRVDPDLVEQCALAQHHDIGDAANDKHHDLDGFTVWTDSDDRALTDTEGESLR